jgi:hypothetical protein
VRMVIATRIMLNQVLAVRAPILPAALQAQLHPRLPAMIACEVVSCPPSTSCQGVHAYGFAGGRCCSEKKLIAGENSQGASAGTRFHLFAVAYET